MRSEGHARIASREGRMFGSGHLIAGLDVATGPFALMVFSAAAAAVMVAGVIRVALRRAGYGAARLACSGFKGQCAGHAGGRHVHLSGCLIVWHGLATRPPIVMPSKTRAAELTARALAPGSPLGCLDAVANALVEHACEKSRCSPARRRVATAAVTPMSMPGSPCWRRALHASPNDPDATSIPADLRAAAARA